MVADTHSAVRTGGSLTTPRPARSHGAWGRAFTHIAHDYLTLLALSVVLIFAMLAVFANTVSSSFLHVSPTAIDLLHRFEPPSSAHWLGTDDYGRDQLSRLLYGARVSLSIGLYAAMINLTIGLTLGLCSAFYGSAVDDVITWLINTARSVPSLFLLLIVASIFKVDATGLAWIIGLTSWMGPARLVRGQALEVKEREYVAAARSMGASNRRIMLAHILPNVTPILLIILGIDVGGAILSESALSYLGLGVQPPVASWGNMLTNAQNFFTHGPWLVYAPGVAIAVTVWCLYTIGDGLRDALDPRSA